MTQQVRCAPGEGRSWYQAVLPWIENFSGFVKATKGTGWFDPILAANWALIHDEDRQRGAYCLFPPLRNAVDKVNFFASVLCQHGLQRAK
jgi:hypothetical protein